MLDRRLCDLVIAVKRPVLSPSLTVFLTFAHATQPFVAFNVSSPFQPRFIQS